MVHALRVLQLDPFASPLVYSAAERMLDLTAHMTFLDPDGYFHGPTHFNSRSSTGAVHLWKDTPNSFGGGVQRWLPALHFGMPHAHAFLRTAHLLGPRLASPLDPFLVDFHEELACHLESPVKDWNNKMLPARPSCCWPYTNDRNVTRSYEMPLIFVDEHQSPGRLPALVDGAQPRPGRRAVPLRAHRCYLRNFDDEFVYARFGSEQQKGFAVLLHTGPVSSLVANAARTTSCLRASAGGRSPPSGRRVGAR